MQKSTFLTNKMSITKNNVLLAAALVMVAFLILSNLENGFFWDTVQLGSRHANFYLSTNFSNILLPVEMDSGHIPAFGMYIALLWKCFGRSLIVSHLAMLPFAIGIVWVLYLLCRKFINTKYSGIALLLILADPTLLAQMTLVSPDVPLVFFFLLCVYAILENRRLLLASCILLLFLISMRGMMVSLCLLSLDLYCNVDFRNKTVQILRSLVKRSALYVPALLIFVAYNTHHYLEKGWIGYHKDSPWAKSFEPVDLSGFVFNIGVLGWRFVDFGRIGIWLVFSILILRYRKQVWLQKRTRLLVIFTLLIMLLLPLNTIWATELMQHRYFIPIYLTFALLCANVLFASYVNEKLKYLLAALWMVILLSGNFWIYPDTISKGWDSTLAHLPYYKLRSEAMTYLDSQRIDFKDVTSFFPNVASIDYIDLNNDQRNFDNFDSNSKYVFYSNIFNIDDATYYEITTYEVLKRFESKGVFITIYKKR